MGWWDDKAADLQSGVRYDESKAAHEFSDSEARRAAVRAREDLILAVSHLSTANRFLSSIRRWLIALTIIAAAICVRLFWASLPFR